MGSDELDTLATDPKIPPSDSSPAIHIPPHGFLASGHQAHPYMWGVQPMIPSYGAQPHPYVAMYPHGGLYAHPSLPPGNTPGSLDADINPHEGKEKLPIKRMRGSLTPLNIITRKTNEDGKTVVMSPNGVCSKSVESGSDSSSEGSNANSQINFSSVQPATNLNIATSAIPRMRGQVSASAAVGIVSSVSRNDSQLQDEKELKRQRRKQSNRESAHRSRLRKQAECDEVAQRAEALKEENTNLRSELNRIRAQNDRLMVENATLKARLGETREDLGSSHSDLCLVSETREIKLETAY